MLTRVCKICNKKFIYKHREKMCSDKCKIENKKQWSKKYWSTDKVKEKRKTYKKGNKVGNSKKWQSSEKGKEWWSRYRKENREIIQQRINKWRNNKRKTSALYRLTERIRGQLKQAVKRRNFSQSQSTIQYLGVKLKYFKKYLEHKFQEGMTWENFGKVWHIDHIIPISMVDTSKEENIKFVFHYRNLQPMFAKDNLKKSNKVFVPAEKGDKLRDIDLKIKKILKRVHPEQELDFNIITTPIDERGRGVEIILKRTIN
jgi:hypothetical protein